VGESLTEQIKASVREHPEAAPLITISLFVRYIPDVGFVIATREGSLTAERFQAISNAVLSEYAPITQEMIDDATEILSMLRIQAPIKSQEKSSAGYIYVLQAGSYYKIGQSINVDNRLAQIRPKMPIEPVLIHSFSVDDMDETEEILHTKFAQKRTNGEWFALNEDDVSWLCELGGD
jgi:hypothetical protein